jgi:hypothetical protein
MKQTAVDKLLEYFIKEQKEGCSHWCIHDLIAQLYVAKEMEKEQLCYFYVKGAEAEINNPYVSNIEFYNKTFKSE